MPIPEKTANLSSSLLVAKDIPRRASIEPAAAAHSDAPRAEARDPASEDEAPAAVLSQKGTASAAGFRPDYWSYQYRPTPAAASEGSVVPLFSEDAPPAAAQGAPETASVDDPPAPMAAVEPVPPPEVDPALVPSPPPERPQALRRSSPVPALVVAFGCVSLAASGWLYWSSLPRSAEAPQVATPAPRDPTAAAFAPEPDRIAEHTGNAALASLAPVADAAQQPLDAPDATRAGDAPATAAAPAPVSPERAATTLSPEEIGALMARGDEMLATGDIAAARLFYQRAAEQGLGAAATAIGQTFDPLYLEQAHVRGIRGEPALAAEWYRRASAAGDRQGQLRLSRLLARFPG